MSTPDVINGLFEAWGSAAMWLNVQRLCRDKQSKGYRLDTAAFFWSWGAWNVWYYPHLHQPLSFVGGLSMMLANTVYTGLTFYYLRRNHVAKV